MKPNQLFCFACLVAVSMSIISCSSSSSLKVTSDYDKQVSFAQYTTFAIDTLRASQSLNLLNRQRIINAVKAEMASKGFTESTTPNMLVHVSAILKKKQSVSANTAYYGYGYGYDYSYGGFYRPYVWGGSMGVASYTTYSVDNYTDGSLIIGVADAHTQKLLWEGIGNKEIDQQVKEPDTAIPLAVNKIMVSFPPGTVAK